MLLFLLHNLLASVREAAPPAECIHRCVFQKALSNLCSHIPHPTSMSLCYRCVLSLPASWETQEFAWSGSSFPVRRDCVGPALPWPSTAALLQHFRVVTNQESVYFSSKPCNTTALSASGECLLPPSVFWDAWGLLVCLLVCVSRAVAVRVIHVLCSLTGSLWLPVHAVLAALPVAGAGPARGARAELSGSAGTQRGMCVGGPLQRPACLAFGKWRWHENTGLGFIFENSSRNSMFFGAGRAESRRVNSGI